MILEAMYNGEFYPCETVVPTSPEYRKAIIACEKLMEQLSQRRTMSWCRNSGHRQQSPNVRKAKVTSSMAFRLGLSFSRKPMNRYNRRKKNS